MFNGIQKQVIKLYVNLSPYVQLKLNKHPPNAFYSNFERCFGYTYILHIKYIRSLPFKT